MSDGIFQRAAKEWAPPWFRGRNMGILLESVGALWDVQAERIMDGRLAANPFAGGARLKSGRLIQCEEDALPWHARDRGITLYETEPVGSRRVRLSQHHQLKRARGTHQGEMRNLQPYFLGADGKGILPRIRIVHQSGSASRSVATWHTLSGSLDPGGAGVYSVIQRRPSNFDWDGRGIVGSGGMWSRSFAFIYMYGLGIAAPNTYDDGHTYDDGSIYDVGGLTYGAQQDLISMLRDWKSAHSWLNAVALVWDATSINPIADPAQDPAGWWSLPSGAGTWASSYSPTTHLGTRPPGVEFILVHNAP